MSWRDSASQLAQDDHDALLNLILPLAQQMLEREGEFYPFGAAMKSDGQHEMVMGYSDTGDRPPSAAMMATMIDGLRGQRDGLRAVGFCANVRVSDSDAVRVDLEHREGQAMAVLLPYKKRFGRGVEFSALRAGPAKSQVWLADE